MLRDDAGEGISSLVSNAGISIITEGTPEGKGLFCLTPPHHTRSLRDVRARTQGRNWHRDHGGMLLPGFFSMAFSAHFVVQLKITHLGLAPYTVN